MSEMVERAAKALAATDGGDSWTHFDEIYRDEQRAAARAALLAALDPDDEDTCNDIGCELAGGSGDEAEAVEWANITRCVLKALRNHIAQGGPVE